MKTKLLIPLLAGLGLLCACKGKGGYEVFNSSSGADTTKIDTITGNKPKLVKTAGIRFKVKNVQQTAERVMALVNSYNGMVIHHQMTSVAEGSLNMRISEDSVMQVTTFNTNADLTVKIPPEKLLLFMAGVARMGIYVNSQNMDITDKSLDYLSSQLRLKGRTDLINAQKKGKVIIKDPAQVLLLKDDMVDEEIANRQINDAVKNSVVTLSLYQSNTIYKEVIANDDPSAYNLPFFKRMAMVIEDGWGLFESLLIGLANLWVFACGGIVIWMIVRYYRGKKLASPAKG